MNAVYFMVTVRGVQVGMNGDNSRFCLSEVELIGELERYYKCDAG